AVRYSFGLHGREDGCRLAPGGARHSAARGPSPDSGRTGIAGRDGSPPGAGGMNGSRVPHILHVHSSFDPGGKEMRCVRLIAAFGARARHSIVSAVPDAIGAGDLIPGGIELEFPDFPRLTGWPTLRRLKHIAEAMR